MSKKVILNIVLLILTAGLMVVKAAYGTEWPLKSDSQTE